MRSGEKIEEAMMCGKGKNDDDSRGSSVEKKRGGGKRWK